MSSVSSVFLHSHQQPKQTPFEEDDEELLVLEISSFGGDNRPNLESAIALRNSAENPPKRKIEENSEQKTEENNASAQKRVCLQNRSPFSKSPSTTPASCKSYWSTPSPPSVPASTPTHLHYDNSPVSVPTKIQQNPLSNSTEYS